MIKISTIKGLKEIYKKYDAYILDQWGVMHDGKKGYNNAVECVEKLFESKKKLIIISNSSKRKKSTLDRLPKIGFNTNYFDEVMTSGEMIWQSLKKENYDETINLGKNCFYIYDNINTEFKVYIEGLEKFNFVNDIEKSDFILACTPFYKKKVVDYIPLLTKAKNLKLPFICANPDFDTVERNSDNLVFCMGTIAELYKNMGGKIFYLGKPSIEIYNESTRVLKNIDKSKILSIGDSIYHDIQGANNFGIDSLLITSTGIHQKLFDKKNPCWESNINTLRNLAIKPTFISSEFIF